MDNELDAARLSPGGSCQPGQDSFDAILGADFGYPGYYEDSS